LNYLNFSIIFISSYEEYAIKAIRWRAFDYLLKPFGQTELRDAILLVLQNKLNVKTYFKKAANYSGNPLVLRTQNEIHFVLIPDISHCKGDGNYTTFYLKNNSKIVVSSLLKNYEELLSDKGFIRVHKSFLVPINQIKKFDKTAHTLLLENGSVIEVSKRKKEELLKLLKFT
jgi:two-component system LytT family response regulator